MGLLPQEEENNLPTIELDDTANNYATNETTTADRYTLQFHASLSIASSISRPLRSGIRAGLERRVEDNAQAAKRKGFSTDPSFVPCCTKQYAVAWEFAKWVWQKAEGIVVPVGILHVAVPRQIFQAAQEVIGDDWRHMVWGEVHDHFS